MIDATTRRRFLEAVLKYERAGVAPAAARAAAARELCIPLSAFDEADAGVLEKQEQSEIRKLLIAYGFRVYNLSQSRASKVGIGIPDLWFAHQRLPIAGWCEVKRQRGGVVSRAQQEFRDECVRAGVVHILGDRYAVVDKLLELEVAVRGSGQYGIEPIRYLTMATSPAEDP